MPAAARGLPVAPGLVIGGRPDVAAVQPSKLDVDEAASSDGCVMRDDHLPRAEPLDGRIGPGGHVAIELGRDRPGP